MAPGYTGGSMRKEEKEALEFMDLANKLEMEAAVKKARAISLRFLTNNGKNKVMVRKMAKLMEDPEALDLYNALVMACATKETK